jgi:tRNA(Ile)-lysidine synthase
LSGIHPVVEFAEGRILRPLLASSRAEVEAYLKSLHQSWREDSSNSDPAYTRNRIRHELLPLLDGWNPQLREHLSQMAELARDEEAWWQTEVARLAPQILLTGRPVRGGGRAASDGLALDLAQLAQFAPALQRRLLRHAAGKLNSAPDFSATEAMRKLAVEGRAGQKLQLAQGLTAERTSRELRLTISPIAAADTAIPEYVIAIPGEVEAPAFGLRLRIIETAANSAKEQPAATLRNWKPGDRVRLRHSSGARKVKEVLERLHVTGSQRALWPVLEFGGQIVWMRGVEVEPTAGFRVEASNAEILSD